MADPGQSGLAPAAGDQLEELSMPRDARVITSILKESGVTNYEPRVVNHLLEFLYRYVTDTLEDAKLYSTHAGNSVISKEDIKLAIKMKLDHSFTMPPPKDVLVDLAKQKNSTTLPSLKNYTGARLPPDRYCLTSMNYRLKDKPSIQKKPYWLTNNESSNYRALNARQPMPGAKRKWREEDEC